MVSDESGRYKIELARGRYTVTAEHPDFLPYSTGNGFSFVTGIGYQTFNIFMHRAPNIGDSEDGDSEDSDSEDSDSTDVACGTSPDAIFGYASGTLKALAQAGANGSQYATDPASLTFPLSSVTFVELADGATWSAIHFGESTGVLVVHNSACNARMKNLNSGTFKGLIISDDIVKVHTTVIGAVVSMTQSPSGNCIGNGNGEVLYSIAALENASLVSVGGGGELTVVSWLE